MLDKSSWPSGCAEFFLHKDTILFGRIIIIVFILQCSKELTGACTTHQGNHPTLKIASSLVCPFLSASKCRLYLTIHPFQHIVRLPQTNAFVDHENIISQVQPTLFQDSRSNPALSSTAWTRIVEHNALKFLVVGANQQINCLLSDGKHWSRLKNQQATQADKDPLEEIQELCSSVLAAYRH